MSRENTPSVRFRQQLLDAVADGGNCFSGDLRLAAHAMLQTARDRSSFTCRRPETALSRSARRSWSMWRSAGAAYASRPTIWKNSKPCGRPWRRWPKVRKLMNSEPSRSRVYRQTEAPPIGVIELVGFFSGEVTTLKGRVFCLEKLVGCGGACLLTGTVKRPYGPAAAIGSVDNLLGPAFLSASIKMPGVRISGSTCGWSGSWGEYTRYNGTPPRWCRARSS